MTISVFEIGHAPVAANKADAQNCGFRIASWIRELAETERARRELTAMNDVELKDIGLTRGEIGTVTNGHYRR